MHTYIHFPRESLDTFSATANWIFMYSHYKRRDRKKEKQKLLEEIIISKGESIWGLVKEA